MVDVRIKLLSTKTKCPTSPLGHRTTSSNQQQCYMNSCCLIDLPKSGSGASERKIIYCYTNNILDEYSLALKLFIAKVNYFITLQDFVLKHSHTDKLVEK